jgi:hypothetical protein
MHSAAGGGQGYTRPPAPAPALAPATHTQTHCPRPAPTLPVALFWPATAMRLPLALIAAVAAPAGWPETAGRRRVRRGLGSGWRGRGGRLRPGGAGVGWIH